MKNTATDNFREKLKLKNIEVQNSFKEKFPEAHKFFLEKGIELGKIRQHSARLIGAGALTGTLLLAPPTGSGQLPTPSEIIKSVENLKDNKTQEIPQKLLIDNLKSMLPEVVRPLARDEEKRLEQLIKDITNIPAKASLEGEHLNTTYGYIGAEQHLKRYPGDILENHGPYYKEGIAPGLGAWGYFAHSKGELTTNLVDTEKWYAVVQTLYLPDWSSRQPYLRDWYKYRKVLIVNTKNGNSVVASIADSGPAAWTGKHFGGSPEVMEYLGGPRYKKGAVLIFFIDDPENKISLGPVEYNKLNISSESLIQI
ncbi:hypothetical protein A2422_03115 [Candidatus Woesebacteria bacterium RIFOXYC1_FULL_31_51]|uniref:Uncharacterized protein n=1 Tax=Candidatus Woesebacteria bacterium GW2011_GWC2_31_9 TaxID=1618586 RepID=A0A0G0BMA4_9BACT|nr:MAG: hypothetical protein UR17_C0001G0129 [Candidatus Woesebacteria bacterium GW2011_GWF1_31_35]KKP23376.1 MAG: hypothetical protein UR11_C0001G0350 [Candidatus Woesebacteria bacterium GW2011_GWC1_30_29]KKP25220.1 MAG: hypothetical protein UR13_C0010G0022 [Candidatus Woesebacteria bacterium GW2011_GWD1_31_12]KKP27635.1 MAG: hypothetical protein UR16_C0003G0295 [Candidatus Woesebacteria bacterium GW2011_GWB1_31_29]KKP32152.1 MAG: hypothetical protein UR21_C0002G0071 [Candidatus Woesebacteria 